METKRESAEKGFVCGDVMQQFMSISYRFLVIEFITTKRLIFLFLLKAKYVYNELMLLRFLIRWYFFLSFFFTRSIRIGNRIESVLCAKNVFSVFTINRCFITILLITYRIFDDISKLSTFIYNFISLYRLIINYFRTNNFT